MTRGEQKMLMPMLCSTTKPKKRDVIAAWEHASSSASSVVVLAEYIFRVWYDCLYIHKLIPSGKCDTCTNRCYMWIITSGKITVKEARVGQRSG